MLGKPLATFGWLFYVCTIDFVKCRAIIKTRKQIGVVMKYQDAKLEDNILICPQCGGNNLHQGIVTVFNRNEDELDTQVTCVQKDDDASTVLITDRTTSNPSPRRHGMLIEFTCELCYEVQEGDYIHDKLILAMYQHKGLTLMEWVK